jgi:GTP-binding protein EngB required for normal cell division
MTTKKDDPALGAPPTDGASPEDETGRLLFATPDPDAAPDATGEADEQRGWAMLDEPAFGIDEVAPPISATAGGAWPSVEPAPEPARRPAVQVEAVPAPEPLRRPAVQVEAVAPNPPAPLPAARQEGAHPAVEPALGVEPAPTPDTVEARGERLEGLLVQLADLAREQGMRSLAAEVTGERLPALREGKITVVVLGEFNHGKSSILNALLGAEVLPTGITPTTAVITHIKWAAKPGAVVQYDAQDRKEVSLSALASVVASEQAIEPQWVEVGYPSDLLRDNLVLVDTPGVNDISRQRVEITYGYVPRADVILYVLDSNQILKRSEITFIRDRLLRTSKDRLLFVLGKVDALSEDEQAEVEAYAREKLGEFLDVVDLYPVSARRAMKGGDAGFDKFRAHLLGYLKGRRGFILLDSGVQGGLRVAGMLQQSLSIKRAGYALDQDALRQRVDAVRGRLEHARRAIYENLDLIDETTAGLKATAKHNLTTFAQRFAEAVPAEVDRASVADLKGYFQDWIQDTFRLWLEREGEGIARALEALAQQVIETTNANLRQTVHDLEGEFGAVGVNLDVSTLRYDVSVATLGAAGISIALLGGVLVGGLVVLAAPLLYVFLKDRAEEKTREMAKEQGVKAIHVAGERLEQELVRVIAEYGDRLKTFVESAGARLYQQIDEALQQVVRDTSAQGSDRAALDGRAGEAMARLDALCDELKALREGLLGLERP